MLNINELANALKPIVMPGEVMTVKILKEGKEAKSTEILQEVSYIVRSTFWDEMSLFAY